MPIQPEAKIFPHVVPSAPAQGKDFKETIENLISWSQDLTLQINDLTKQIVDKYNSHIDQAYAHPKSWTTWRLPRPSFQYASSTTIKVKASAAIPARFLVGSTLLESTADLVCDLSGTGYGKLDTGTVAANTTYYLYCVSNFGNPALVASVSAPATGPTGYSDWTYVGAFRTNIGAATVPGFTSTRGRFLCDQYFGGVSHNAASWASKSLTLVPAHAKAVLGFLEHGSGGAGATGQVSGLSGQASPGGYVQQQVVAVSNNRYVEVELQTAQTVFLYASAGTCGFYTVGWLEDPTEYK